MSSRDLFRLAFVFGMEDALMKRLEKVGDVADHPSGWAIKRMSFGFVVLDDVYPKLGGKISSEFVKLVDAAEVFSWYVREKDGPRPPGRWTMGTVVPAKPPAPVKKPPPPEPVRETDEMTKLKQENERLRESLELLQDEKMWNGYR